MKPLRTDVIEPFAFEFKRNPRYLDSVKTALTVGVVWAPETLWRSLKSPVAAMLAGTGYAVMAFLAWSLTRALIVGAGLCGFVCAANSKD